MSVPPIYHRYRTIEELSAQFDPGAGIPDIEGWREKFPREAAQLQAAHPGYRRLRYGPTLAEHLDLYPPLDASADAPAPILVFVHGGYWRSYTADTFGGVARTLSQHGVMVAVVNYALAPAVTVEEITRQVRAAVVWLHQNSADLGGDPERLVVCGHSAGAHLSVMAAISDWDADYGLEQDPIAGIVPISGVYDLAPLPYTHVGPYLQLDARQVRLLSPLTLPLPASLPPAVFAVGTLETGEFRRQSERMAARWQSVGGACDLLGLNGDHHLSVLDHLQHPDSALFQGVMRLLA